MSTDVTDDTVPALEPARLEYQSKLRLADELEKSGRENGDKAAVKAAHDRRRRARLAFEMDTARWQMRERSPLPDRYRITPMH